MAGAMTKADDVRESDAHYRKQGARYKRRHKALLVVVNAHQNQSVCVCVCVCVFLSVARPFEDFGTASVERDKRQLHQEKPRPCRLACMQLAATVACNLL
jgi:hypothetical protein